ncbi:helix-turn-helix domain-containing protein [Lachnospiraceae bacterium]|nr:helix-turn-helix domain-containing protein [Lachnospiraceae bacterium]
MKEIPRVEIKDKILLTIEEAAAYSGISATVLRNRIGESNYNFILKNGTKTMIKRKSFEQYIEGIDAI